MNFKVTCGVNGCPATFTKHNSFYKHVLKHHKQLYEGSSYGDINHAFNQNNAPEQAESGTGEDCDNEDNDHNDNARLRPDYIPRVFTNVNI